MNSSDDVAKLAGLLMEVGKKHHQAYAASDGVDPEWALWYASYLQAQMWDEFGGLPTRSGLVHSLIEAESQFAGMDDWPMLYAKLILENLASE